jgi:hypothetical protein
VVHRGTRRDFIGFNRASHAVLEAAIYATRVHMLPRDVHRGRVRAAPGDRDKTAGEREFAAMALLAEHVRAAPRAPRRPPAP